MNPDGTSGRGAGELDASEMGFDAHAQLARAAHGTLARCAHTGRLALDKGGNLPPKAALPACTHRRLTLLFLMDPDVPVRVPAGERLSWLDLELNRAFC